MILPPGFPGVAFGEASDGDPRRDESSRSRISEELGISSQWALIDQVHGTEVVAASAPGHYGEADGIVSGTSGLPLAIATADCVPVVLLGEFTIALLHAGWRGIAKGIIDAGVRGIEEAGDYVRLSVIGPHASSCCYEASTEVVEAVGGHSARTSSGKYAADLAAAVRSRIPEGDASTLGVCTMHDARFHSYRRDGTEKRQVTVAWIPQG